MNDIVCSCGAVNATKLKDHRLTRFLRRDGTWFNAHGNYTERVETCRDEEPLREYHQITPGVYLERAA